MISVGVLAGAPIPSSRRPRSPAPISPTVGTSGKRLRARRRRDRKRTNPAGPDVLDRRRQVVEHDLDLPAHQVGQRRHRAAVRHVQHVHPGHHLEHLAGDVAGTSDSGRRHVELAGIGFGIGDELGDGLHRQRIIDIQDLIAAAEGGDRRDFAGEIDGAIERGVDHVVRRNDQQRVTVRRRARDHLGSDIGGGARPVLDDECLAEPLLQPFRHQASEDVDRLPGGKADDDAHRPRWIGLRARDGRRRPAARQRPRPDARISRRGSFIVAFRHPPLHSITSSARSEQRRWHLEAERLGDREIDDELELGRLLDRQVTRFRAAQNFVDIIGCAANKSGTCGPYDIRPAGSTYSRKPCIVGNRAPSARILM